MMFVSAYIHRLLATMAIEKKASTPTSTSTLTGSIGSYRHRNRVLLLVSIGLLLLPTISLVFSSRFGGIHINTKSTPPSHYDEVSDEESLRSDPTLGGLISPNADKEQCLSRGLIHRFRKASKHIPSPYLTTRLREYEAMHKRCGPGSEPFKATLGMMHDDAMVEGHDANVSNGVECKYVVWIPIGSLGNKVISIASTFVYALLTNRVLLLDGGIEVSDLFCEPFPEASWLLPSDFPYSKNVFNETSSHRFGHILETKSRITSNASNGETRDGFRSSLAYLHLIHSYDFYDKLAFCEEEQAMLTKVPWLFLRSNMYFVPALYLYVPKFGEELGCLFPDREMLFHHISRYLFLPTNPIWSRITQFYQAYLANANERVGVQIRLLGDNKEEMVSKVSEQVLTCALGNRVLPNVTNFGPNNMVTSNTTSNYPDSNNNTYPRSRRSMAVLITAINDFYFHKMRQIFLDGSTESGAVVSVHEPSHEKMGNMGHDKKVWVEMCLLSFSDKLITSAWSTSGYASQGLAGVRPWVLKRDWNETQGDDACSLANSMDPCFHLPPYFDCKARIRIDPSQVLPFIQHCEDVSWGIKLFNDNPSPP